ncbi:diaminobutyrate-2-oxoglutarate transaminase [Eubacterium ruminantium]|uniref:Diaminobutyrate--2-oxoglutarate transaminase n=1 Tax=Eubacterium ruminantium TaxID=42322 RepID=A0A1T4NCE6_9FIRM|nr:diaminobutyrate--2-oxoglutarate transaminase [Eubacterium ruminantium]SCW52944.1 diaminobutyrate-2-oxoglutarate transaminase [Eubacterium ruminantium]SDM85200.1 diaminobutyrate aminotransferase apoenzyme [Eubacterium ruminantium]SJZ76894.1 diaminobutyrate aminotransferase apoenzyme [Eubacterium ruminantium]
MNVFVKMESNVRSYCRSFPKVFNRAKGSKLFDEDGNAYIDFFAGAGALNYGHNNEYIKKALLSYIESDGISHGLDMYTVAKKEFMTTFNKLILEPRNLDYKLQFCGPTGTNAVEAALKLARKVKKRTNVLAFMGAFHGMTLGSLSVTSGLDIRRGAGVPLGNVSFLPYPSQEFEGIDTLAFMRQVLTDDHSGVDKPAAVILETTQAEGGINVAPTEWLQEVSKICKENDILLIVDDVQVGCGRTGEFFSFERAGIEPDMVVLSKSISGYGLPMSLLLLKPELDIWEPGEHNGTFRGNQMAFVAAKAALIYREESKLEESVKEKEKFIKNYIEQNILPLDPNLYARGIGLIWGIDCSKLGGGDFAKEVCQECFSKNMIIERAGRGDSVVKLMPALTIKFDELKEGCKIVRESIEKCLIRRKREGDEKSSNCA